MPPLPASTWVPGAEDGFVHSDTVNIHFVQLGKKDNPLLVMIHGFPDFWYTWRAQMPALAKQFHVVAIDQRGYNLSGQPEGVENYTTDKLVGDLLAVVDHFNQGKAVIVGHDWGGLVAWTFAMTHPERVNRLIVLNLPHPRGLIRELTNNPQQQKNSQYARDFQKPDAAKQLSPDHAHLLGQGPRGEEGLSRRAQTIVDGRDAQLLQGQLSQESGRRAGEGPGGRRRTIDTPDQVSGAVDPRPERHGPAAGRPQRYLELDRCRPDPGHDPGAGHFVQQDAADLVTRTMVSWLNR